MYRFAGQLAWRCLIVLFFFIAAGLYIVFALRADEGILWVAGEVIGSPYSEEWLCSAAQLDMVDHRGMGVASPLGRRAAQPCTFIALR